MRYYRDREVRIAKALSAVDRGLSMREADRLFEIPYSTLSKRYRGISQNKRGPPTALSSATEQILEKLIIFMADIGLGLNKSDIMNIVKNYLKESNQLHLFPESKPCDEWYHGFIKRHPNLSQRCASNLQKNRWFATHCGSKNWN
jgi:hypothetical protein